MLLKFLVYFFFINQNYANVNKYRFKKNILVKSNSDTPLNDVHISVVLNTHSLVTSGKINQQCSDLVFLKNSNINSSFFAELQLDHWIESGCNSLETTFWIDVGHVSVDGEALLMYYGSTTSENYEIGWDGKFVTFTASAGCSYMGGDWRYTQQVENKFIRGHSNFGSSHGDDDHSHAFNFETEWMIDEVSGSYCDEAAQQTQFIRIAAAGGNHKHDFSGVSSLSSNLPSYYPFPFCENEKLDLFKNIVVLFDRNATSMEEDFSYLEELDNRFPRGSVQFGPPGGYQNHSHPITTFDTSTITESPAVLPCTTASGMVLAASDVHTHAPSDLFSKCNNFPEYLTMVFGKVNKERTYPKPGMIVGATRIPPMGWTHFLPLQYKFPLGSRVYGLKGGSDSHAHQIEGTIEQNEVIFVVDSTPTTINIYHRHNILLTDVDEIRDNIPEYIDFLFVKRKESLEVDISIEHHNEHYAGGVLGLDDLWWLLLLTSFAGFFIGIVIVVTCVVVFYLIIFYKQQKTLKKIDQIEDFDLLLQEHRLESAEGSAKGSTDTPSFKINKKMFEIDPSSLKILGKIGQGGGEAIVYKAEYLGQTVGYKCFKVNDALEEDKFSEFEKEVEILASISFPFILSFIGTTLSKNRIGIVMEYAENGDLFDFLTTYKRNKKRTYPLSNKFRMLFEISSALAFLHGKKIIHRDIKLRNVLVMKNETTRLMDFGLSKLYQTDQTKTRRVGTGHFMAPEVVLSGQYNNKCDVYSFSILIYIVLTENYSPYGDKSFGIESKVAKDYNFRPSFSGYQRMVSKDMKEFITQNWNENPSKRMDFIEISNFLKKKCSPSSFRMKRPPKRPPKRSFQKENASIGRVKALEKGYSSLKKNNQQLKKQVEQLKEQINQILKKIDK